ncbi:MAG: hypothetical protein R3B49_07790 [Phycisphaerales bacterium]
MVAAVEQADGGRRRSNGVRAGERWRTPQERDGEVGPRPTYMPASARPWMERRGQLIPAGTTGVLDVLLTHRSRAGAIGVQVGLKFRSQQAATPGRVVAAGASRSRAASAVRMKAIASSMTKAARSGRSWLRLGFTPA